MAIDSWYNRQRARAQARDHWTIENSVHWIRNVVFGWDARTVRSRSTTAVMVRMGDIVRGTLRATGWANTARRDAPTPPPPPFSHLHGTT